MTTDPRHHTRDRKQRSYGGRGLPFKILQFFKDLMKNEREKRVERVKWNVTAKQRKKND